MSDFQSQSFTHSLVSPHPNKIVKPKSGLGNSLRQKMVSSPTSNQRIEAKQALAANQRRIANEDLFDQFIEKSLSLPIHEVFEPVLRVMFHGDNCILWIDDPMKQCLYSPSSKITAGYSNSLPGFVFKTQSVLQIKDATQCPSGFALDPRVSQSNSPHFFFPLANKAVVQVMRRSTSGGFNDVDMETAQLLMHKFSIYGDALFSVSQLNPIALELFKETPQTLDPCSLVQKHFNVDSCKIWRIDPTKQIYTVYDPSIGEMVNAALTPDVSKALATRGILNETEGENGPVLTATVEVNRREIWIGVLSGREALFNASEEAQFNSLMRFLIKFIVGFGSESQQKLLATKLGDLLNVFSLIACTLNLEELEKTVSEQTLAILDCESIRYELFKKESKKPENCLIAQSLASSEPLVIDNPAKAKGYNPEFDSDSGQEPHSFICCPIKAVEGKVLGYIAAFSKHGKGGFDASDSYILQTICSFTATSCQHCKKMKRLKSISTAICKNASISQLLHKIMKATEVKRICVYSAYPEWALVAEDGEQESSADLVSKEIRAIKKKEAAGDVNFIPLVNSANEEVGAFGYAGELDDAQVYAKLICTMIDTTSKKQDVQLDEIIDSSKAALASAAAAIDLGENIFKHSFPISKMDIAGLYKVVFKIFSRFGFFESFSLSNMSLYGYLRELGIGKEAVNALQLFATEILQSHTERICNKQQLMAGCMACLLSDFKAESHLLEESTDAVVKITRAITIMSNDQVNLFRSLGEADLRNIWSMIIELTLATDPSNHFKVIEAAKKKDEENNEIESAEERIDFEFMKLFVLCAKYAECARYEPKESSLKSLSINFWRRCDLSKTSLASTKREDIQPEKQFVAMIDDAVKPAFQLLTQIEPSLSSINQTVLTNLSELCL